MQLPNCKPFFHLLDEFRNKQWAIITLDRVQWPQPGNVFFWLASPSFSASAFQVLGLKLFIIMPNSGMLYLSKNWVIPVVLSILVWSASTSLRKCPKAQRKIHIICCSKHLGKCTCKTSKRHNPLHCVFWGGVCLAFRVSTFQGLYPGAQRFLFLPSSPVQTHTFETSVLYMVRMKWYTELNNSRFNIFWCYL